MIELEQRIQLLEVIHENPNESFPRQVYADWLEDNAMEVEARTVRLIDELNFQLTEQRKLSVKDVSPLVKLDGREWIESTMPAYMICGVVPHTTEIAWMCSSLKLAPFVKTYLEVHSIFISESIGFFEEYSLGLGDQESLERHRNQCLVFRRRGSTPPFNSKSEAAIACVFWMASFDSAFSPVRFLESLTDLGNTQCDTWAISLLKAFEYRLGLLPSEGFRLHFGDEHYTGTLQKIYI